MNLFGKFPLVRLKQFRDNPAYIWYYLKRLLYYKYTSQRHAALYKDYRFLDVFETLDLLLSRRVSLARFSDGDIEQLTGAGEYPPDSDWSQRSSKALRDRLEEVLNSRDPMLLIAHESPSVFCKTRQEAAESGVVYNMWTDTRRILYKYLSKDVAYGHAHVFVPQHNPDFDWKRLHAYLSDRDVIIVTGGTNTLYSVSLGRRIFFIETGKHDAFERYSSIRKDLAALIRAEDLKKEEVLILASLGPTADILAYDLTKEGWQVWDTGHFFRYADRHSFLTDEKKTFTKQMRGRTPEEVREVFEKCLALYDASKGIEYLTIPKPISCTATTIVFERLTLPTHLSSELYGGTWEVASFEAVGRVLGSLHRATRSDDGSVLVHGDLWTHNIAVSGNHVYLFDCDAPLLAESIGPHMRNMASFDLASFIVSVCASSSFKSPLRLFSSKRAYIDAFLRAYVEASGSRISIAELQRSVGAELDRWHLWQKAYGHRALQSKIKCELARISARAALPREL